LLSAASRSQDAFLVRAVRYLAAEAGVRQYLDVGLGLANGMMLHGVVQLIIPTAPVVYVTDDVSFIDDGNETPREPGLGQLAYGHGTFRDPARVLEHAAATLDLDEPVAVVLTGVLHLMLDEEQTGPAGLVAEIVKALAGESHVVISHLACDIQPGEMTAIERQLNADTGESWQFRSHDQVRELFAGLDLVDPGVVQVDQWRRDPEDRPGREPGLPASPMWAGVGRKP
jgi:hypothetical protein